MIILSVTMAFKSVPSEQSQVDHEQSVKISFSRCHRLTPRHESGGRVSLHKVLLWLDFIRTVTDEVLARWQEKGLLPPAPWNAGADEDR